MIITQEEIVKHATNYFLNSEFETSHTHALPSMYVCEGGQGRGKGVFPTLRRRRMGGMTIVCDRGRALQMRKSMKMEFALRKVTK